MSKTEIEERIEESIRLVRLIVDDWSPMFAVMILLILAGRLLGEFSTPEDLSQRVTQAHRILIRSALDRVG